MTSTSLRIVASFIARGTALTENVATSDMSTEASRRSIGTTTWLTWQRSVSPTRRCFLIAKLRQMVAYRRMLLCLKLLIVTFPSSVSLMLSKCKMRISRPMMILARS